MGFVELSKLNEAAFLLYRFCHSFSNVKEVNEA